MSVLTAPVQDGMSNANISLRHGLSIRPRS